MTKETKAKVVQALYSYHGLEHGADAAWRCAIDAAMAYCDKHKPAQGKILRLKYIGGLSDDAVMQQIGISRTSYQKHKAEALATVMEYAARRGLI